jgi:hypothetical protein
MREIYTNWEEALAKATGKDSKKSWAKSNAGRILREVVED